MQWKLGSTKDPLSELPVCQHDGFVENITKEAQWQIMLADDVVLCAREKYVLELELEQ